MNKFITIILLTIESIIMVPIDFINSLFSKRNIDEPVTIVIENRPERIKVIKHPIEDKTKLTETVEFLNNDTVSDKSYGMGSYQCTQFSRDLSAAAKKAGIEIGGIILGNSPNLETLSNHALNYIIIDNIFYIINPESDFITPWDNYLHKNTYKYYKLYPDGTLLPTRWNNKLYNVMPTSMLSGKQ